MARIKGFLSKQDKEKLDHAFIFCRLDYCNGIFTSLKQTNKQKKSIRQLQPIQNTAASQSPRKHEETGPRNSRH